jgi:hypothetical protein
MAPVSSEARVRISPPTIKNPKRKINNNQRNFFIKIWTLFLDLKSCLFLRNDGRKQRPDKFIIYYYIIIIIIYYYYLLFFIFYYYFIIFFFLFYHSIFFLYITNAYKQNVTE